MKVPHPGWIAYGAAVVLVHGSLLALSAGDGRVLFGDERMYLDGARRLAAGEVWHLEPLWPPLYPRWISWLLPAGGSPALVIAAQVAMLAAAAWLLADLTRRLTGSRMAALVAGGLVPLYPPLAAFAYYLWPEVPHLLLFLGALWLLVRHGRRPWALVTAGGLLGLALLTKSLLGPFLPFLMLPLVLAGTARERARRVAWVVLGLALAVTPDVVSNLRRSTGVLIADSTTFNLWVGLEDRARKDLVDLVVAREYETFLKSAETFPERRSILREKIARRVEEKGLVHLLGGQLRRQYFRLFDKDSFLTDQLPGGAVTVRGLGYRDPPALVAAGLRAASYLLYAAVLVAATAGLAILLSHDGARRNPWLWTTVAFLAYNLVLFLGFHVKSRYRVQLLPFLFLYAGCAAAWASARLGLSLDGEPWGRPVPRSAWIAAATGAAVLLFLAFGRPLVE